nr:MAG TPA: hypothetical protein [Caudoviricetes sp.]
MTNRQTAILCGVLRFFRISYFCCFFNLLQQYKNRIIFYAVKSFLFFSLPYDNILIKKRIAVFRKAVSPYKRCLTV